MAFFILLSVCHPLVTISPLPVSVAILWNPYSICFLIVHWLLVSGTGSSLLFSVSPLCPTLLSRRVLFGFSPDELRCVPCNFVYVINVCKFVIWVARKNLFQGQAALFS